MSKAFPESTRRKAIELRREGKTYNAIRHETGVSPGTVLGWMRDDEYTKLARRFKVHPKTIETWVTIGCPDLDGRCLDIDDQSQLDRLEQARTFKDHPGWLPIAKASATFRIGEDTIRHYIENEHPVLGRTIASRKLRVRRGNGVGEVTHVAEADLETLVQSRIKIRSWKDKNGTTVKASVFPPPRQKGWVRSSVAAEQLGVTLKTLRNWARKGCPWLDFRKLKPPEKLGTKAYHFAAADIAAIKQAMEAPFDDAWVPLTEVRKLWRIDGCPVSYNTAKSWVEFCPWLGRGLEFEERVCRTRRGPKMQLHVSRADVDQVAAKIKASDEPAAIDGSGDPSNVVLPFKEMAEQLGETYDQVRSYYLECCPWLGRRLEPVRQTGRDARGRCVRNCLHGTLAHLNEIQEAKRQHATLHPGLDDYVPATFAAIRLQCAHSTIHKYCKIACPPLGRIMRHNNLEQGPVTLFPLWRDVLNVERANRGEPPLPEPNGQSAAGPVAVSIDELSPAEQRVLRFLLPVRWVKSPEVGQNIPDISIETAKLALGNLKKRGLAEASRQTGYRLLPSGERCAKQAPATSASNNRQDGRKATSAHTDTEQPAAAARKWLLKRLKAGPVAVSILRAEVKKDEFEGNFSWATVLNVARQLEEERRLVRSPQEGRKGRSWRLPGR